jgi:hypothetical protein
MRQPNRNDVTIAEEVTLLQSGLEGLVQRQCCSVQSRGGASKMPKAAGDVQVVSQGDPMARSDLQHFMLAVAVESRPLDARLGVGCVC